MAFLLEAPDKRTGDRLNEAYARILQIDLDRVQKVGRFHVAVHRSKAARDANKAASYVLNPIPLPREPQSEQRTEDGTGIIAPALKSGEQWLTDNADAWNGLERALLNQAIASPRALVVKVLGEDVDTSEATVTAVNDSDGNPIGINLTIDDPEDVDQIVAYCELRDVAAMFYRGIGCNLTVWPSKEARDAGRDVLSHAQVRIELNTTKEALTNPDTGEEISPAVPSFLQFVQENADAFNALRTASYDHIRPAFLTVDNDFTNLADDN